MHPPEPVGIHTIIECPADNRDRFMHMLLTLPQLVANQHDVIIADRFQQHLRIGMSGVGTARFRHGQPDLRARLKTALPDAHLVRHRKQRTGYKRHGINRDPHVRATPAHGQQ